MPKVKRPPLNSAEFNLREVVKQLLLLEEHLSDDEKFCEDCIRKHLMHTEALAEEALTLNPSNWLHQENSEMANNAREWMVKFSDGMDKHILAARIRTIRKRLMNKAYDPRVVSQPYFN